MAGGLRSSLDVADAAPNTREYLRPNLLQSNITTTNSNTLGFVPNNFVNINSPTYDYLNEKGFVIAGRELFHGTDTTPVIRLRLRLSPHNHLVIMLLTLLHHHYQINLLLSQNLYLHRVILVQQTRV